MKDNKSKNSKKLLKIIIIIFLFFALIAGGFYGTKLIYHTGVADGYKNFKSKTEETLTSLGSLVLEKSELSNLARETLGDFPEEADAEDFETYLENLETLISKVPREEIKSKLSEFKTSVSEFLDFYNESDDNEAISEKYNELKIKTSELSNNLTNFYNEKIKSTLEELNR